MSDKTSYINSNKPLYISNLTARMQSNERFGANDFEKWVFSHLDYPAGCSLLDVGCGTGKASFKLLELQPQIGEILAIDFADTAIDALRGYARQAGISRIRAANLNMEKLAQELHPQTFDRIFSIYAVHYSYRMAALLCEYAKLLKPGGSIFFCGPDAFCNTSVMRIMANAQGGVVSDPIPPRMLQPFIGRRDLVVLSRQFAHVEVDWFENEIHFPSADAFSIWWKNHDLYRPEIEDQVLRQVEWQIDVSGRPFAVNKNVVGVTLSLG